MIEQNLDIRRLREANRKEIHELFIQAAALQILSAGERGSCRAYSKQRAPCSTSRAIARGGGM